MAWLFSGVSLQGHCLANPIALLLFTIRHGLRDTELTGGASRYTTLREGVKSIVTVINRTINPGGCTATGRKIGLRSVNCENDIHNTSICIIFATLGVETKCLGNLLAAESKIWLHLRL